MYPDWLDKDWIKTLSFLQLLRTIFSSENLLCCCFCCSFFAVWELIAAMALAKRNELSLADRVKVLEALERPKASLSTVAKLFGISKSQAGRISQNKQKILEEWRLNVNPHRKRKRKGKDNEVEEALLLWFQQALAKGARLSGPMLKMKAKELATDLGHEGFQPTDGWLSRWKTRQNIVLKREHGERQDADHSYATDWIKHALPAIIAEYSPNDIFNADETGLFYRGYPDRWHMQKDKELTGGNKAKDRVSVMCCANMSGTEKRPLLVIGKSKRPQCLPKDLRSLPVTYTNSANAWMTGAIFQEWLYTWEQELRHARRKICLFVDQCSAHLPELKHKLRNINLVFFPNTTRLIQPMEMGVIKNLKGHYRSLVALRFMQTIDHWEYAHASQITRQVTLLDGIYMLQKAWNNVKASTLANCFRKAGFIKTGMNVPSYPLFDDLQVLADVVRPQFMSEEEFILYVNMDIAEPTAGNFTRKEFCTTTKKARLDHQLADEQDDEQADAIPSVTNTKAMVHLNALMNWLQLRGSMANWEKLLEVENEVRMAIIAEARQSKIADLFKDSMSCADLVNE
nr:PREDICTED: tigger transposable element-derived protein 4-like [Latimeria chalumnae]|eukprot:XP_006006176.1 PREDICTED: tigger transposable element-derived protein 4-like [Latimeria chalumnae]